MDEIRIVIVEDDAEQAKKLELDLIQAGLMVVATFTNAEDFLLFSAEQHVDLAIVDILLTGKLDGIDAVKQLRDQHEGMKPFPVIYLTVRDSDDFIRRAEFTFPAAYLLKPYRKKELLFLVRMALYRHRRELELHEQKDKVEQNLWHIATHDPLTNLPNRRLFYDRLEQCAFASNRDEHQLALLYLDLDDFKQINDSYGHVIGDEILKSVATRLQRNIRAGDTIARIGGDEFAIIVDKLNDTKNLANYIQKLINLISQPFSSKYNDFNISVSIGIGFYRDTKNRPDILMRNADSALYRAKEKGKNNFCFYTREMTRQAKERVTLESELRDAITRNELEVYYQPQIDLNMSTIIGAEALIRWNHPRRGLLGPAFFIPVAEKSKLINLVGEYVLDKVCSDIHDWYRKNMSIGKIAVNLSGRQLTFGEFASSVSTIINRYGCSPTNIELEITESFLMHDPIKSKEELSRLSRLGLHVAIDDFGTGYSSLSYLRNFPFDKIKIDRSFVRDLMEDDEDRAIVKTIIQLCKNLNVESIAEGIETQEQYNWLVENGCDFGQGFLMYKPMPVAEFTRLLR